MKTTKKCKRLLLLWVLMVNLLPSIKDGQVTWTTMRVEAQQYIVEGMVDGVYKCVNTLDANDWFPSSTTSCLYVQYCACAYCRAKKDCDGPCLNPLCPSNDETQTDPCICCQQPKNTNNQCVNTSCYCSPFYDPPEPPSGGGGGGSTPEEEEEEEEEEEDPCSGMKNGIMTGNPLNSMQILGSKNNGVLGGCFGTARGRMHTGIDLSGSIGDPVYATHSGTVIRVVQTCPVESSGMNWDDYKKTFKPKNEKSIAPGKRVYIDCGGGFVTWYWHLNSTNVQVNQQIAAGDVIGTLGNSGNCSSFSAAGPHLHYQTLENGVPVDPMEYLFSDFDMETGIGTDCD